MFASYFFAWRRGHVCMIHGAVHVLEQSIWERRRMGVSDQMAASWLAASWLLDAQRQELDTYQGTTKLLIGRRPDNTYWAGRDARTY